MECNSIENVCSSSEVMTENLPSEQGETSTDKGMANVENSQSLVELVTNDTDKLEIKVPNQQGNRRFQLRPRKKIDRDIESKIKKVIKVINKKTQRKHHTLETIFEEPVVKNGNLMMISLKKARRAITFSQFVTKAKIKTRQKKAKKIRERQLKESKAHYSIQDVQVKLWNLDLQTCDM